MMTLSEQPSRRRVEVGKILEFDERRPSRTMRCLIAKDEIEYLREKESTHGKEV